MLLQGFKRFLVDCDLSQFYASNVFLNLRDVVSCQSTDLSFLLAVFFNFVYLLLINLYYYYYFLLVINTNLHPILYRLQHLAKGGVSL